MLGVFKKLWCSLFGSCYHDWSKWRDNFQGSSYQRRECLKCGKRQERTIW